jgi:uncharacterized protein YggE
VESEKLSDSSLREETKVMTSNVSRAQTQMEGVTVVGEAVRRVPPESAEFLIEITASSLSAAQALHDNQLKTAQVAQALDPLGVHAADLQTISLNVYSLYAPIAPPFGGMPQIGTHPGSGVFPTYAAGVAVSQNEVQSAAYHTRNTLRVTVRDLRRLGDVVDTVARAGATVMGPLGIRVADEGSARRGALEAAGKDARAKAETLAAAAGKQVGDALAITEDIVVSNGAYAALRLALPFAFGAGTPHVAGELEYYARVSASFRLQ